MSERVARRSHRLVMHSTTPVVARRIVLMTMSLLATPTAVRAQTTPTVGTMHEATRLDREGRTTDARAILQQIIDSASEPRARAAAHRAMAMSHAFDGDCGSTAKYEVVVMAFWKTREADEPQNAFYQQGEMANEAARVCIDVGELDIAEQYYLLGSELGLKEPDPKTHPKSLWDFRLAHARAQLGDEAKARAFHEKAFALATSHNPPAAFTRPYARKKLAR